MPFCWSGGGGLHDNDTVLESVVVTFKVVGGPEGTKKMVTQ